MGLPVVKVEDIDFTTKITPPAASNTLDLIGYGEHIEPPVVGPLSSSSSSAHISFA
jgi:hypothetical protein